jgi:hypothetical protein
VGCELACSYCYVARHRAYRNPLELYGQPRGHLAGGSRSWAPSLPASRAISCLRQPETGSTKGSTPSQR